MLADVIPELQLQSDPFATASSPETALIARFDDRFRPDRDRRAYHPERSDFRPAPRPDPRSDARRDFCFDDRPSPAFSTYVHGPARGTSYPKSCTATDDPPASSTTLAELQKSFASIQSQLDKHSRQACQGQDSSPPRRDRAAFTAQADDSAEASYTAFVMDITSTCGPCAGR
jgi:hypothetical protein